MVLSIVVMPQLSANVNESKAADLLLEFAEIEIVKFVDGVVSKTVYAYIYLYIIYDYADDSFLSFFRKHWVPMWLAIF